MAYIISVVGTRFLRISASTPHHRAYVVLSAAIGVAAIVAVLNVFTVLGRLVVNTYGDNGVLDSSYGVVSIMANIGISYTHQIGLVLPFAVVGFFWYLWRETKWIRFHYPFAVLAAFTPLIGYGLYVSMLLAPFVAILFAFVVAKLWEYRLSQGRANALRVVLAALIVLSTATVSLSIDRWNESRYITGDEVEVPNQVYTDAVYLKANFDGEVAVFNQPVLEAELQALCGIFSTRSSGVASVISGYVTPEMIEDNITRSWVSFPLNVYYLYRYKYDYVPGVYTRELMMDGTEYIQSIIEPYSQVPYYEYYLHHTRFLVILDNAWPHQYRTNYGVYDSVFISEVRSGMASSDESALYFTSYELYQSEGITQYAVAIDI